MIVVFDTATPSVVARAVVSDHSTGILSISSHPGVAPTRQIVESAEAAATTVTPSSLLVLLESLDCGASEFLELYQAKRRLAFGRITQQDALGLLDPAEREAGDPPIGAVLDETARVAGAELRRSSSQVVVAQGQSHIPIGQFLGDILLRFGSPNVEVVTVFREPPDLAGPVVSVRIPVGRPTCAFTRSEVVLLTLVHYLVHQPVCPIDEHPALNVARIASWALRSSVDELMPAARGARRDYPGLYRALRATSRAMVTDGCLDIIRVGRPGPVAEYYRLTPVGHTYAGLLLRLGLVLGEGCRALLAPEVLGIISQGRDEVARKGL